MSILHRISLLAAAVLGGTLLCAGCQGEVSGGERTHQGSLAEGQPPANDQCTGGDFGDGFTCQDFSAFPSKQQILDTCTQAGLQLTAISVTTDGCPDGQWKAGNYQCCPAPPPPPPGACTDGELGDGMTCQDFIVVKQQSVDACQQAGTSLVDLQITTVGCPDGQWSHATYKCCEPGQAEDPCTYTKVGDGVTCQDESVLTQQAADACAAAGLPVQATKLGYDCPGGQSTWAAIACCPP